MISVLDYGCGNIGSIVNMLRRVGQPAAVIRTPEEVLRSQKLILPGVGAFDAAITYLRQGGFQEALEERVTELQAAGKFKEGEEVASQSVDRHRALVGPRHAATGVALTTLAVLLMEQGKFAEARPLLEESLEITREAGIFHFAYSRKVVRNIV